MALCHGDALDVLRVMATDSVDCVVTSPPYYFMRDYGGERGQYGLEGNPQDYVDSVVSVMREVFRVMRPTGSLWLNLGDGYSQRTAIRPSSHQDLHGKVSRPTWREMREAGLARMSSQNVIEGRRIPEKSLMMLPERVALAMQADGWILRNKIVWSKTSAKPDPAKDRLMNRWEPIYLFVNNYRGYHWSSSTGIHTDVWSMPTAATSGEDNTARFPDELPRRCITLGSKLNSVVLDPFCGSLTTGRMALDLGRRFIGIDLHRPYLDMGIHAHRGAL
jgi:DNA modification methylase